MQCILYCNSILPNSDQGKGRRDIKNMYFKLVYFLSYSTGNTIYSLFWSIKTCVYYKEEYSDWNSFRRLAGGGGEIYNSILTSLRISIFIRSNLIILVTLQKSESLFRRKHHSLPSTWIICPLLQPIPLGALALDDLILSI